MPLRDYGVLRARVVDHRVATTPADHFQLHVVDDDATHWRIAVNVTSKLEPAELEYVLDSGFAHPILADLAALPSGWRAVKPRPGGIALDFIRANLFDRDELRVLPFAVPGPDNDLNEKLGHYVRRATADPDASAFAFGERWGPEPGSTDGYFGFEPGNGVHDIHMNQANAGSFAGDDGVWQDGALLLHFPAQDQWVAIFLKFQSQGWHTDDATGHAIASPDAAPDGRVRIVAALANAIASPEVELVTLINTTAATIDVAGWRLLDRDKHAMTLAGEIAAGETLRVVLAPPVVLPNRGGAITLLDANSLKVDGVSYTAAQASVPGATIVF